MSITASHVYLWLVSFAFGFAFSRAWRLGTLVRDLQLVVCSKDRHIDQMVERHERLSAETMKLFHNHREERSKHLAMIAELQRENELLKAQLNPPSDE